MPAQKSRNTAKLIPLDFEGANYSSFTRMDEHGFEEVNTCGGDNTNPKKEATTCSKVSFIKGHCGNQTVEATSG